VRVPVDWWRYGVGLALAACAIVGSAAAGYYYVDFSNRIDERLGGDHVRAAVRVFARPIQLAPGSALTVEDLVERLNDLGYAERVRATEPGEFAVGRREVALVPRGGTHRARLVRVVFQPPARNALGRIVRIEAASGATVARLTLEPPLLSALPMAGREKRRYVRLDAIPPQLVNAVLAIEDRRFYEHPGVDVIRAAGALITNIRGDRPYLVGGSTLTQQLVKNLVLTPEKTLRRKIQEQFMALILERRLSKDEILELYLNEVYLGQRGSFAVHGVAEAARLYFGKDVANLSLAESAMLAGLIQSPGAYSPQRAPERALARRNLVLSAMVDAGYITREAADRAAAEPLNAVTRGLDAEAPYFVDLVAQRLEAALEPDPGTLDVYTTLDLRLQRLAQNAVRDGLRPIDERLARRKRPERAQAALVAVDPRTGEVLAMVGGRAYAESQYNRAAFARRQPGSVFKPFVYLAAFERAAEDGLTDISPATLVWDEPTTFTFNDQTYAPSNYRNEYDGLIPLRLALARSRNVVAVKVAQWAGYDRVVNLWGRIGSETRPQPYPSIALGVFEATPLEIATAYTIFPNGGVLRPLRFVNALDRGKGPEAVTADPPRYVAAPDTTYLVTDMMRSVLTEGTGAGVRSRGFTLDAAGKTGTTDDLRDAWFVGFTPELLTVVWVGLDDNRPIGLSGAQAALPIWTAFMKRALAGHPDESFAVPGGIVFEDIDPDTGLLATYRCPRVIRQAFLRGTQPTFTCQDHRR
jgi:penicillin-binding protein 1B